MPWTEITRGDYRREGLRYASDLTEEEWALIAPRMPAGKRLGRPRTTDLRRVVDALLYMATTGCQWRMLPRDFPPYTTVQGYFYDWRDSGLWARINHHLVMAARELQTSRPRPASARRARPSTKWASASRGMSSWRQPDVNMMST